MTAPASAPEPFAMWTIYDHPNDIPDSFVARKWIIVKGGGSYPTDDVIVTESLIVLREIMINRGLARIDRHPDDDAKIVETWI